MRTNNHVAAAAVAAPAVVEKMTTLDALSTLDVSIEILEIRAAYWETVAERHVRAGREAQAARLIANVKKIRALARDMKREERVAAGAKTTKRAAKA
jgi:hypothetical protein